jgi:hypothetical protein
VVIKIKYSTVFQEQNTGNKRNSRDYKSQKQVLTGTIGTTKTASDSKT